jgi:uncharacterized iron-regulated protein
MEVVTRTKDAALTGKVLFVFCLAAGLFIVQACQAVESSVSEPSSLHSTEWKEWDVLDAKTRAPVNVDEWIDSLSQYDIVYLGEEHHNQFHIEAALRILQSLVDRDLRPVLALEMFGWDGQAALDRYIAADHSDVSRQEFLAEARWTQNWGGSYDDYAPLLDFARSHRLMVRAMNPPKPFIRAVVKKGLAGARSEPEWNYWGMAAETIVDDPLYRERILGQLQQCHGGGAPEDYQTMYEASMVRDEAMAKTLVATWNALKAEGVPLGPMVSYTGGGHIQYKLPVPKRVARRLSNEVSQTTVYLTSFEPSREAEIRQYMEEGLADYVWLTPMGKQGPPRRCR